MNILLIEDDSLIAGFITKGLREESYNVDHETNGSEGLLLANSREYDLVILDIMLPGMDGVSLCRALRENGADTPVIMLTAKDTVRDKVRGLESGADDYITKPFSFDEFLARIHSVLRRGNDKIIELVYQELRVDTISHRVFHGNEEIILRPKEYAVLKYLLSNQGRVLTRTRILESVWGYDFDPSTNIVDVYIKLLREKLKPYLKRQFIRTVRGMGYMMENSAHD